jgi:ATP-dependent protease ClpP protease subunit
VNAFLNKLDDGDDVEIDITSCGGSVTAGLAICNLIKRASANGHKTTAHVIGIAASMASVIACSCDELEIDSNALFMMHLPWTSLMGNAIDLRKEADTLDKYCDALIAIYRTKFNMDDTAIRALLEDETWLVGKDA